MPFLYIALYAVASALMTLGCALPAILVAVAATALAYKAEVAWVARKATPTKAAGVAPQRADVA